LQEIRVHPNKIIKIKGYNIERKDRVSSVPGHGGLVIAIKEGLSYSVVDTPVHSEIITITFKVNNVFYSLVNVYISPTSNRVINQLQEIIDSVKTTHTIIVGDFNAHSHSWGGDKTDLRGRQVEVFVENNDLCVINDGSPTYQHYNGTTTPIDLTITSPNISVSTSWQVLSDSMGSDHFPILITLNNSISILEPLHIERYVIKKADWATFRSSASETFQQISVEHKSEEELYADLKQAIITAANLAIPVHKPNTNQRHKSVPYWSVKCKRAVATRAAAAANARRLKTTAACIEHRRQRALCQRTIRAEKQLSWQTYCDSLTNTSKLSSVWRMAKSMKGDSKPTSLPSLRVNNVLYETSKEKADLFANKFSQISTIRNHTPAFKHHSRYKAFTWRKEAEKAQNTPHILDSPMELHELQSAITQAKRGSAPGQDSISYEMLKQLPKSSLNKILHLFNSLWSKGTLISEWKHSIIIPIKKTGASPHSVDSYRPIALTAALCKIMERIVNNRLIWYLEKNNLLNSVQAGFRSNRSTIDQLLRLHTDASNGIKAKKNTMAIFLDFSKAFDLMWHEGLLYKLRQKGITGNTYNWIKNFLQDRSLQVRVGASLSDIKYTNIGTPQGSVLSPLLFLIFVSDFPENAQALIQTSLFADDSSIWKIGGSLKHLQKTLQNQLDVIAKWCDEWGFIINAKKTVSITFTHKRNSPTASLFTVNNLPIAHEKSCRFLGMLFDSRLSWSQHIAYIIDRTKPRINLLRSLAGQSWGCGKQAMLTVYRTLIRSVLDYGSELFSTANKTALKKLDVLQATCLRLCCGAMRCTPHSALQNECGELPLNLRRTEIQMRHCVRIATNPDNPANQCLLDNWFNYISSNSQGLNHLLRPVSHMLTNLSKIKVLPNPPWLLHLPDTDLTLSHKVSKTSQSPQEQYSQAADFVANWSDHIPVYTDASKSDKRTACSIYSQEVTRSWRLVDGTSVYMAEIQAIHHALEFIYDQSGTNAKYVIFTDSLSAVQAIAQLKQNKSDSLFNAITLLTNSVINHGNTVNIAWVPSHVGISGNERADAAAKLALKLPQPVHITPLYSVEDCYTEIKSYINTQWQLQYDQNRSIKHYKSLEPDVSRKLKFSVPGRELDRTITRLRLGYCLTNTTLSRYNNSISSHCDNCNIIEDLNHFITCPVANLTAQIDTSDPITILKDISKSQILARNIIASGRKI
jgi:ribonuclease HI